MKSAVWIFLPIFVIGLFYCSDEESKKNKNIIKNQVKKITQEQAELNKDGVNVPTPDNETLKSRLENIFRYFCDRAAENRVAARFILPDAPEQFYLSDPLAAHLNAISKELAQGYVLNIEIIKEPELGQYRYVEATLQLVIEAGDKRVAVELSYETKYNKFHEKKAWIPQI